MTRTRIEIPLLLLAMLLSGVCAGGKRVSDLDLEVVDSDIQPGVTIEEHPNRVTEEYRVNNNLYMIKVTPSVGAPYYLVDDDGSGDMEYRRNSGTLGTRAPQWTLFSW
jgi:hypothetical protein